MSFKEAMEHYQKGTASAEERAMVEEELEKTRLIEEYRDAEWKQEEQVWAPLPDEMPPADVKNLRSRLRKHNLGLVLVSVLLAMLVFVGIWFGLVPVIEKQYWDPEENTFGLEYGVNDIDLLLDVYNQLFEDKQAIAGVTSRRVGFASYELSVQWWDAIQGGNSKTAVAKLEKGKLELPPELSRQIPVNVFDRAIWPYYSLDEESKERYYRLLKELPEYVTVTAYVSFAQDKTMAELVELEKTLEEDDWMMWIAVRNSGPETQLNPPCGFDYVHSGMVRTEMNAFYPNFEMEKKDDPKAMEQHFVSLLRFMKDREEAIRSVGEPNILYYHKVLDYVQENGVKSYGCTLKASPKTLLHLLDEGIVSQVWPSDVDFKI